MHSHKQQTRRYKKRRRRERKSRRRVLSLSAQSSLPKVIKLCCSGSVSQLCAKKGSAVEHLEAVPLTRSNGSRNLQLAPDTFVQICSDPISQFSHLKHNLKCPQKGRYSNFHLCSNTNFLSNLSTQVRYFLRFSERPHSMTLQT